MGRAGVIVAVLFTVLTASAHAAAPHVLMFDGKPLPRPVVLAERADILRLVTAWVGGPRAPRAELRARCSLRVSLFWSGRPRQGLKPSAADQFGRYYPAAGGMPAVIDLPWGAGAPWPRQVAARALRILRQHGVPTRLSPRAAAGCRGIRATQP
jgi:hypothetical protein